MAAEKQTKTLSIRVEPAMDVWLTERAKFNGRYVASEIMEILMEKMRAEPLKVVIRELTTPSSPIWYCAAWGGSFDDFAEEASEEALFTKINEELAKRNLRLRDVAFDRRPERLGFGPRNDGAAS
jgi:hypothetical protein